MAADALEQRIAQIRALPGIAKRIAPRVALELRSQLLEQAAAELGPDGKPWAPTQSGKPALRGVADGLSVRAVGTVVIAELSGVYARHDRGSVRGGVRRRILPPSGTIPRKLEDAIERLAADDFDSTMGGAP